MTQVFLAAQIELREAMQRGSTDLGQGLAAWDAAVAAVNRLTAVLAHAQHAELDAARALAALVAWTESQSDPVNSIARHSANAAPEPQTVEQA